MPKWALVTKRLFYEEKKNKEKEIGAALKAMTSKHHINKRGTKYLNCGKNGHMERDCRLLGEDFKESLKRNNQNVVFKSYQLQH